MAEPEAITATAPRPAGRTVFTQDWMRLTFIHWEVDPSVVAPFMPPGVRPDVFEGKSFVALVPFSMERIGLFGAPPVPYFGTFLETNVRLYGVDEQGRRGVVFCSLEASRLLTVAVTRVATGLNYLWARMRLEEHDDVLSYTTRRRWPGPRGASSSVRVRVGEPIEPSPTGTVPDGPLGPVPAGSSRPHALLAQRASGLAAAGRDPGARGRRTGRGRRVPRSRRAATDQRPPLRGRERALRPAPPAGLSVHTAVTNS